MKGEESKKKADEKAGDPADDVAAELKKAADGLTFMSETDAPLEVVRLGAEREVTPEVLRKLSGRGGDAQVREQTLDEFFRAATDEADWKSKEELESARRFQALVRLLKTRLTGAKVYRVGDTEMDAYALGKTAGGEFVGIKTKTVET